MSFEMLLLEKAQIASGCAKKLTIPSPESCDMTVDFLEFVANNHLVTWVVVIGFMFALITASTFFMRH